MCVFAHSSNLSAKVLKLSKLQTCVYSETHMCMLTAIVTVVGWPTLDPWVSPSIDFFYNRRVCVCGHSSSWSAKVVECSEPSHDFLIRLLCNTHVCVHSSNWSANPQLTSSATQVCSAHSSNRSAQVLKLTKLELTCSAPDMCVFRNTHMCMPTAAIGRPALDPWVQPSIDFFCNTRVCVCVLTAAVGLPTECSFHLASSLGDSASRMCVCVCFHSSNWSANPQLTSSATHVCR